MSKLTDIYDTLRLLSVDGICYADQRQILELSGLTSRRHLQRKLRELEALGLIKTVRYYDRQRRKTKNYYFTGSMGLNVSHRSESNGTQYVPSVEGDGTQYVPSVGAMGLIESHYGAMGLNESPMAMDGMDGNEIKNKKIKILDFIDEPSRSYCAAKLDLETARQWRQVFDFYTQNDAWDSIGVKSNPVGVIIFRIKNGEAPPPLQIPLPAGSLDLSQPFVSRGMTRAEIEAAHSVNGATLGDDGIWR